ncbi:hypothetical protein VNO78_22709 [Psophocarpus tetragonolobus]|uniref:Uncharacterized protein n=1 Tax=Psophocarpus tetragonolobus TaxID=3891 RepID=A0AAN9S3I8_PSOTE
MISSTPNLQCFSLFFRHHPIPIFFTHTPTTRSNALPSFWGFAFVFSTTFRSESQSSISGHADLLSPLPPFTPSIWIPSFHSALSCSSSVSNSLLIRV